MVSLHIFIVILLVYFGSRDARSNKLHRLLSRRQLNNQPLAPPYKGTPGHYGPMNLNISSFDRRPGSFFMALSFVCKRLSNVTMDAQYKRQRSSIPVEAVIFEEIFGPLLMKLDAVCESLSIVRATLEAEFKNIVDFNTLAPFGTHNMTYPQFMDLAGTSPIPNAFVSGASQASNGQMKKRLLDALYKYLA